MRLLAGTAAQQGRFCSACVKRKLPWRSADSIMPQGLIPCVQDCGTWRQEGAKEAVQASKSPLAKMRSPLADLGIAKHQPSCCHFVYSGWPAEGHS
jgi:hypothetical protein